MELDARHANRWRLARWGVIAALLILPAVAMQFTEEVSWSSSDFVAAAVLLVSAGAVYEVVARRVRPARVRLMIGAVILCAVALIWHRLRSASSEPPRHPLRAAT